MAAWFAADRLAPDLRLVAAADAFYLSFLALIVLMMAGERPDTIRRRARVEDVGIWLVIATTLFAVVASIVAIFSLVGRRAAPDTPRFIAALAGIPLGWFTLQVVAALRYAHLYYSPRSGSRAQSIVGGLEFPGGAEPVLWDFLYFSFTIGMTAQTSDIAVVATPMRRLVLGHAVVSFFFNAVIIALAVSVAYGLAT